MKYLFIVCAHFFITLLNRHNPLHGLSYFFYVRHCIVTKVPRVFVAVCYVINMPFI